MTPTAPSSPNPASDAASAPNVTVQEAPCGASVTPALSREPSRGAVVAASLVLTLVGIAACIDAWSDMLLIALADEEASHLWLVPIVAAWLILARRATLASIPLRPSLVGPVLVIWGGAMNWYGFYHYTQAAWHGGAVLVAMGCFLTLTGWRLAWRLLPVFVVLLFLVPVPGMIRQELAMPLQKYSATITRWLYEAVGLTVIQTGNQLHFNGKPILIAEACNGMRMIFALLLVSYAIAFSGRYRPLVQAILLAASPLLAVICNVIRLVPTVYLYGQSEQLGDLFHTVSGWAMVVVAYFLVTGLLALVGWLGLPLERASHEPVAREAGVRPVSRGFASLAACGTLALLTVIGVLGLQRPRAGDAEPYHARAAAAMAAAPRSIGDWAGRDEPLPPAAVKLLRPNATVSRAFTDLGTGDVASFVIVQTRDARDMIGHYPPNCYPSAGWTAVSQVEHTWRAGDLDMPGMLYTFSYGPEEHTVASVLLLPDGRFPRNMADVVQMSSDYTKRFFGAAQVQVLVPASLPSERRDAIIEELLAAHRPIIDAIRGAGD